MNLTEIRDVCKICMRRKPRHRDLLTHAGRISAEIAKQKADAEYEKFRERTKFQLSPVEIHFIDQFEAEQKRLKDNGKK